MAVAFASLVLMMVFMSIFFGEVIFLVQTTSEKEKKF
jgi:hypothetical protein